MTFRNITIGWLALSTVALSFLLYRNLSEGKTAYVEVNKLYNGFDMTKEMKKKLDAKFSGQEAQMDSLYYRISEQTKSGAPDPSDVEARKSYNEMRYEFEAKREEQQNTTYAAIYERINEYIKQYGKENNYKVILGANGSGSLLYGNESEDITEKLLTFMNDKYRGK